MVTHSSITRLVQCLYIADAQISLTYGRMYQPVIPDVSCLSVVLIATHRDDTPT
jgi:hypothetical protein